MQKVYAVTKNKKVWFIVSSKKSDFCENGKYINNETFQIGKII